MADGLKVTITGLDKALPASGDVKDALQSAIQEGVKETISQVQKGFDSQRTPGGASWVPLSQSYAKQKARKYGGRPTLVATGQLRQSVLSPQVTIQNGDSGGDNSGGGGNSSSGGGDAVVSATLEVTDPKAAYHQFGTGRIPARPFFSLEGEAAQAVTDKIADTFIKKLFKK